MAFVGCMAFVGRICVEASAVVKGIVASGYARCLCFCKCEIQVG
jgi:hypothetical protein